MVFRIVCSMFFCFFFVRPALSQDFDREKARSDFIYLWSEFNRRYAYFDQKQTNWNRVREIYLPKLERINSKYHFILFLEKVLAELYDSHISLNVNTENSMRIIPSGTDIWGELMGTKYLITSIRQGAEANELLKVGDQILRYGNAPIKVAVDRYIGKSIENPGVEVKSWAFRMLMAGDYRKNRNVTLRRNGKELEVDLGVAAYPESLPGKSDLLHTQLLDRNIAYIKINNSLGDNRLVSAFSQLIDGLKSTKGLVLDLRNTPGGGNTLVGRAILGKFIDREHFYQKHEIPGEEQTYGIKRSWAEIVSPNGDTYRKPVVILIGRWTGSMGEGIAVGFDGLERAKTVGTKMAGLTGAVYSFELPYTKFRVNFTAEKLYHINGIPREEYVPNIEVDLTQQTNGVDLILQTGLAELRKQLRKH